MKVILNQVAAGPQGVLEAGAIVDLPDGDAQRLLDNGQASPLSNKAQIADAVAHEVAAVEAPEAAVHHSPKFRK